MKGHSSLAGRAPAFLATAVGALICASLLLITVQAAVSEEVAGPAGGGFFEDFETIEGWEPLEFPKIKEHTAYSTGIENSITFLIANSSSSASAIVLTQNINVYETPVLRWRWRAMNIYSRADLTTKKGDDSPLRVYVMFEYDPARASAGMRIKYALAKAFYGKHLPHASLNYVWASRAPRGSLFPSAYTSRSKVIVMRSGSAELGKWVMEETNILKDYRRAFGEDPPARARIAVMNDSDNTKEAALSFIDHISVSPLPVP